MTRIYLDYAATTPMDARVLRAMRPYFSEKFGNPSSLHSFGQAALAGLDMARESVAKTLGADFRQVVFTGSATEANNLIIRGIIQAIRMPQITSELSEKKQGSKPRVIVSAIEHESVLKTARSLAEEGLIELKILPVDKQGIVKLGELKKLLSENTALVSVMYANNEVGSIQPIAEVAEIIRNFRNSKHQTLNPKQTQNPKRKNLESLDLEFVSDFGFSVSGLAGIYPLFHTDAVQALQYLDCGLSILEADFITLSGHKIYGPKGVGALVARSAINPKHEAQNSKQAPISKQLNFKSSDLGFSISGLPAVLPLVVGGGQEFGLRSGTENVANIAGFARALQISEEIKQKETERIANLQDYFWKEIKKLGGSIMLNGPRPGKERLPNNLNIRISGVPAEEALIYLDMQGVAVSSGSACAVRAAEPSHVLLAMGLDKKAAKESLRVTFGRETNKEVIKTALRAMRNLVKNYKDKSSR